MSIGHISEVLSAPPSLRPNLRLVAIVYAESANREDDIVCLGIPTVSGATGYSERQAQSLTRELVALEVLVPVEWATLPATALARLRKIPAHRRPNSYRFNTAALGVQSSHPIDGVESEADGVKPRVEWGAATRRMGCSDASNGVNPTSPKPEENRIREPEENLLAPVGACPTGGCDKPGGHPGVHQNPWFDIVPVALGYRPDPDGVTRVPDAEEGLAGMIAGKARRLGDPPERIVEAAQWIAREWGPSKLTAGSLHRHYERATSALAALTDYDRDRARAAAREARTEAEILELARKTQR